MSVPTYYIDNDGVLRPLPPGSSGLVLFTDHERAVAEAQADMDHASYVLGQTAERQRSVTLIADAYKQGREDGEWVEFTDHERAVAEAVKKALDSARARLLMVPSIRCHPDNPNIEMVEQEEAYCAVLDVLPIGIPGYSHPKNAIKAAVDEAVAAEREACAQVADRMRCENTAKGIRARGQA